MASSFKRAGAPARPAPPQGTHLSVQNGQLLTSSGLTDLDDILSGGLVLGTITLIEEDLNTRHNLSLCKYLLAEGAVCGHALMVASASGNPRDLLRSLPAVISDEEHRNIIQTEKPETDDASRLKIAWRYKDTPVQAKDQAPRKTISHSFDLSRPIAPELLVPNRIEVAQLPTENTTDPFKSLFETISKAIAKHNCDSNAESKEPRNVIRILLQSFGSPMWSSSTDLAQQLHFLHALRGLLRSSFAVCYVTFPSHLFPVQHVRRVLHLCDSAVRMQSFQDAATHPPAFSKYNGLVHVTRLPRLNALTPPLQEATVYGFISKRRRFYIEQLHIPPADEGSSEPAASASAASLMCVPTKASKLDF